ncbi:MAG: hypothetical protein ACI37V_04200, partial [Methanobrevibacter sp.]
TVDIIDGKGSLKLSNLKNSKYHINTVFNGDKIFSNVTNNISFNINVPNNNNTNNNNTNNRMNKKNNANNINNNKISPSNSQNSTINIKTSALPKTGNPIIALLSALIILIIAKKRKN